MKPELTPSIIQYFSNMDDPRTNLHKKHPQSDILFITICAVICGADNWVAVATFGRAKERWLTPLLDLEFGIPSHDTFQRICCA